MDASVGRVNRSILEALGGGLPVVQPDHGAYPERMSASRIAQISPKSLRSCCKM